MTDPYRTLGISKNSTLEEVRSAYRKMAAKYHPDAGGDSWVFQQIQDAYEAICSERVQKSEAVESTSIIPHSALPVVDIKKGNRKAGYKAYRARKKRPPYELIGGLLGAACAVPLALYVLYLVRAEGPISAIDVPPEKGAPKQNEKPSPEKPKSTLPPNVPKTAEPPSPDFNDGEVGKPNSWSAAFNSVLSAADLLSNIDWSDLFPENLYLIDPSSGMPKRPSDGILSKGQYYSIENATVIVDNIVAFYNDELERDDIDDSSKEFVRERLAFFLPNSGKFYISEKLHTLNSISDMRNQSNELLGKWYHMVNASDGYVNSLAIKEAQKLIAQAIKDDPVSFRASFYLGLANISITKDFEKATEHFEECVSRGKKYKMLLSESDRQNLARAIINLGTLRIRDNYKLHQTYALWKEALEFNKDSLELGHNVQLICLLINTGFLRPKQKWKDMFEKWNLELAMSGALNQSRDIRGWDYAPWIPAKNEELPSNPAGVADLLAEIVGAEPLVDSICINCRGEGFLKCPNRACNRGKIKVTGSKMVRFPDGTVHPVHQQSFENCPTCKGSTTVDCPCCLQGIQEYQIAR